MIDKTVLVAFRQPGAAQQTMAEAFSQSYEALLSDALNTLDAAERQLGAGATWDLEQIGGFMRSNIIGN